MHVFGQEAVTVSQAKRIDEHVSSLFAPPRLPDCIDQPETANQKRRLRQAEIIGGDIPHNVEVAPKFTLNRLNRGDETWIIGRNQADFGQKQRTGVEIV